MKTTLYLGLNAPPSSVDKSIVHCPIIQIKPKPSQEPTILKALADIFSYTHIIFTSQTAVSLFFNYANSLSLAAKTYVAVGSRTADKIRFFGGQKILTAATETAEGITEILRGADLKDAYFFWPHSALSRPIIKDWLVENKMAHTTCVFYDTLPNPDFSKPDLSGFDEIIFTSPSTIDAFLFFYGTFPNHTKLRCIGPITQDYLFSTAQNINRSDDLES